MLSATEFYPITTGLQIVLWIEAIVYLGIGTFELFDDFFEKSSQWMRINGRLNGYLVLTNKVGHKMHAGLCFLLGFVALNGLLEGAVTRFELELIFVSFALIMAVLWATFMPGRLGPFVMAMKPEFWLQIVMFALFSELIRPQVLLLCVVLNLWGILVYLLHTRRTLFRPYTYDAFRTDMIVAEGEDRIAKLDRMVGFRAEVTTVTSDTLRYSQIEELPIP